MIKKPGLWIFLFLLGIGTLAGSLYVNENQNHFTLVLDPQGSIGTGLASSHMAHRKIVADVKGAQFHGKHEFIIAPYIPVSNPHGGNLIGWTYGTMSSTSQLGSLEYGKGCELSIAFTDVRAGHKLTGIGSMTEDGFGPVQRFAPLDLSPGIYTLYDYNRPNGAGCVLELSENKVRFGVFVDTEPSKYPY